MSIWRYLVKTKMGALVSYGAIYISTNAMSLEPIDLRSWYKTEVV
jgi:hypothetical protein